MGRGGSPILLVLPALIGLEAPAAAAAPGCASHLRVALDPAFREARAGLPAVAPARLEAFRETAGRAFRAAANQMCASGRLRPGRLSAFTRLLVQSGSGATETAIYAPAEGPRGTLVFQWIFAEADLALPGNADIQAGIACWANPRARGCAEREP